MLQVARFRTVISIGGFPIALVSDDAGFAHLLEERYGGYLDESASPCACEFTIRLESPRGTDPDEDIKVTLAKGRWLIRRGDFEAEYDPGAACGRVRQTANPYSIDSLLRVVHTLLLAPEGGFLIHAAGAVRNGRAFLFAGVSGAGKTTICRLAPPDAVLLSDEIGYVRRQGAGYTAFGTPFAGELGVPGANIRAPVAVLFLLAHAAENRLEPLGTTEAVRCLLRNVLLFAEDHALAGEVFQAACDFVSRVPVFRLHFTPTADVWELIR